MALKIFKNKGETNSIPINANNLNYNFTEILNLVYPIGRGFIDFTDTDYSNYLGFTWERELIGMTPIGLDVNDNDFNTIGKTGGEKTHTLTIDEMPSHQHSTVDICSFPGGIVDKKTGYGYEEIALNRSSYGNGVSSTGGGQSHNNLQPYQVVAYWKRIA